jgi:hypothetical protein
VHTAQRGVSASLARSPGNFAAKETSEVRQLPRAGSWQWKGCESESRRIFVLSLARVPTGTHESLVQNKSDLHSFRCTHTQRRRSPHDDDTQISTWFRGAFRPQSLQLVRNMQSGSFCVVPGAVCVILENNSCCCRRLTYLLLLFARLSRLPPIFLNIYYVCIHVYLTRWHTVFLFVLIFKRQVQP